MLAAGLLATGDNLREGEGLLLGPGLPLALGTRLVLRLTTALNPGWAYWPALIPFFPIF